MNELRFSCPACGQHFLGGPEYIGQSLPCPGCGTEFTITDPRLSTSLRLQSQLAVAPPGPGAHGAPVSPEAAVLRAAEAREAAAEARGAKKKSRKLTQFLGELLHRKAA